VAVRVNLDNRGCDRERPRPQIFRLTNGQHEISRQARAPDTKAIAPQPKRCDTSAHDAEAGTFLGNAENGANTRGHLGNR
jgi:hypothetical protein